MIPAQATAPGWRGAPDPADYRAEVRAEGPVYGTGETAWHVLRTFRSLSPVLVLRWLRGEALRVADRLDPDPDRSAWARSAVRRVTMAPAGPDCPTDLRTWAADRAGERAARRHIKGGHPLSLTFEDTDCTYTLTIRPVPLRPDLTADYDHCGAVWDT